MKKLLFLLLFLPMLAHSQAVVQQNETPASGANQGNQYFQWWGGKYAGYFIPPFGTNATLNRAADINGLFYVQLSDSTIRFRYNGSWIPIGKGSSSTATYFSSTYFAGSGTYASPLTVIPNSVFPSQTGQGGKVLFSNGTSTYWGTASSSNIYNSDGTLTAPRTLSGGASFNSLILDSLGLFQTNVTTSDGLGTGSMYLRLNGTSGSLAFSYGNGDKYNMASDDGGGFGPTEFLIGGGNLFGYSATLNWYGGSGGISVRDNSGYGLTAGYGVDTTKMGTSAYTYVTSGWVLGRLHSLPGGGGTTTNALTNGYGIQTFSFNGGTSGITVKADTTSSTGLVSKSRLATNLGGYLKLSGGTLTGALSGTSASFSGNVGVNALIIANLGVAGGSSTSLSATSPQYIVASSGSPSTTTVVLPNATTLTTGQEYEFNNNATGSLQVQTYGGSNLYLVPPGGYVRAILTSNSFSAGQWDEHVDAPANAFWGTAGLTVTGSLTSTSFSSTIKPSTVYQTATGTAGTDSVMVKHSGGVVNAISPTYYATTASLSGYAQLASANTFTTNNIFQINGLGSTIATTNASVLAVNNTAAASGAQQYSPLIGVQGNFWNTTASASQPIAMYWGLTPIQGTSGLANLILYTSINNATPVASGFQVSQGGSVLGGTFNATAAGGGVTSADGVFITNAIAATGSLAQWSRRLRLSGFYWNGSASTQAEAIQEVQTTTSSGATWVFSGRSGGSGSFNPYFGISVLNGLWSINGTAGTAGQVPQVNSGATGMQWATVGTVASITPGYGFTSSTAITTSGTLTIDTTRLQTIANFFPKGDTRYLQSSTAGTTYVPYTGASTNVNLGSNTISAAQFLSGTLGYTDTGILGALQSSVNTYNQLIIQNTNSGSAASADVVVNNNNSTASTYYGDFGMNSSGFTGSGAFNTPNMVYLTATTGDLALGTTTPNAIHFVVNGGTSDAMTISSGGTVSIGGLSSNGLVKTTGGTGALSIAVAGTDYVGLASANTLTGLNTFSPSISASGNLARGTIFTPTLTAVANNDVLVSGDFTPTISGVGIISTLGSVTGGSSYTNGTYTSVPLTGGNGSGAVATVVVSGGAVSTVTITTAGTRYTVNDVLSAAAANIGGTGSGFSVPVATLTQTVTGAPLRATVTNIGQGVGVSYTGSWSDGLLLSNTTAATSTLNQDPPSLHFSSFGWGTTGGTSQQVDTYLYNQVNTGTVPNANLTIAFAVAGAKSTGVYTFGSGGSVTFTSGSLTLTRSSQGATAFNSLIQQNTTAATSGTPNQWTPTWYNEGAVWNTSGTPASNSFAFGLIGEGTSSANPYSTLYFQTYLGTSTTPTFVNTMSLTTQGQLGLGLTNTNIQAGSQAGSIFNISASTLTDNSTASGTVTNFAQTAFGQTTLAATNASITYTNGYTVYIANAPTNGTNVTMTNKYAFGVASGASTFGGTINNITLTAPASASTLTIASGSSFITSGAFSLTLTSTATTNATFPSGTGTLAYLAGTNTWTGVNTMILKNIEGKASPTAVNASATLTAAQVQSSITTTSTTAVAFTMPTATLLATQVGAAQGTIIFFTIDNSASTSSGAITITLGTGMTSGLTAGLTVPIGKAQTYEIYFTSATTCVMSQIL